MTNRERAESLWRHCNVVPAEDGVTAITAALDAVEAEALAWAAGLADIEHEDPGDDTDAVLTRLAAAIRAGRPTEGR